MLSTNFGHTPVRVWKAEARRGVLGSEEPEPGSWCRRRGREGARARGHTPLHWGRVQRVYRLRRRAALAHHSTSAHRSLGTIALHCKRVREHDSRSDSTNRIS